MADRSARSRSKDHRSLGTSPIRPTAGFGSCTIAEIPQTVSEVEQFEAVESYDLKVDNQVR